MTEGDFGTIDLTWSDGHLSQFFGSARFESRRVKGFYGFWKECCIERNGLAMISKIVYFQLF